MRKLTGQDLKLVLDAGYKEDSVSFRDESCFWNMTHECMHHMIHRGPDLLDLPAYIAGSEQAIRYLVTVIENSELWVGVTDPNWHFREHNIEAARLLHIFVAPLWTQMLAQAQEQDLNEEHHG